MWGYFKKNPPVCHNLLLALWDVRSDLPSTPAMTKDTQSVCLEEQGKQNIDRERVPGPWRAPGFGECSADIHRICFCLPSFGLGVRRMETVSFLFKILLSLPGGQGARVGVDACALRLAPGTHVVWFSDGGRGSPCVLG